MKSALLAVVVATATLATVNRHAETLESSGTITGRILNSDGSPAVAIGVGLLSTSAVDCGQGTYAIPTGDGMYSALVAVVQTDVSGSYALENIPPGQYYIAAGALVPRGQLVPPCFAQGRYRGFMAQPAYLPGVPDLQAATLVSADSGTVIIKDLRLPAEPASGTDGAFKVSGHVVAVSNAPRQGLLVVQLSEPENPPVGTRPCTTFLTNVGPDGAFEFRNIPPCGYVSTVLVDYGSSSRLASPAMSARQRVTVVDRDVSGLQLGE